VIKAIFLTVGFATGSVKQVNCGSCDGGLVETSYGKFVAVQEALSCFSTNYWKRTRRELLP